MSAQNPYQHQTSYGLRNCLPLCRSCERQTFNIQVHTNQRFRQQCFPWWKAWCLGKDPPNPLNDFKMTGFDLKYSTRLYRIGPFAFGPAFPALRARQKATKICVCQRLPKFPGWKTGRMNRPCQIAFDMMFFEVYGFSHYQQTAQQPTNHSSTIVVSTVHRPCDPAQWRSSVFCSSWNRQEGRRPGGQEARRPGEAGQESTPSQNTTPRMSLKKTTSHLPRHELLIQVRSLPSLPDRLAKRPRPTRPPHGTDVARPGGPCP